MESHTQRIQRLVRAAPRPKPVRKALEVHLINLIENGHHGLLNDFVRQRRDAQRALPPVGLRYIDSSRGLCPVRTTVNPAVQIGKPTLQPGLILFPSHAIHPGRSLPLQRVKAVPEQIHAQMVEQSRETVPSPFPSRLTHTAQSLGHPFPALCRASVGRSDVLLGPRPSLPYLRRGLSLVVRQVHRYYGAVRLLCNVPVRCTAICLFGPVWIPKTPSGLKMQVSAPFVRSSSFPR